MRLAPLAAALARLGPALALVALVACQAQPAPAPPAPAQPAAPAAPAAPPAPAAAVPAAAPAPTAVARLSPPVDVKIGLVNITGDAGTYIALERGYFEAEGLQVEIVSFPSSQEQIPALATNQLQFGTGSLDVSLLNAVARGVDLRIVNDRGRYDPSYTGSGIGVRSELYADGTLDEVAKLKGKTMGISVLGTTTDLYLELMLGPAGLTLDDVTFTVMPMPNMAPALSNGAVDAAWLFEPFVAQITSAGIGKMLTATGQVAPQHYGGF